MLTYGKFDENLNLGKRALLPPPPPPPLSVIKLKKKPEGRGSGLLRGYNWMLLAHRP